MYQPSSPCVAHDARLFGILWTITSVPGDSNGVRLKSNSPNMWVQADVWGSILDCLIRFRLIVACCNSLSHSCRWKSLSTLPRNSMKCFLKFSIALYALFALLLLGGPKWYLLFMEVISIFKYVYASLYMKYKPGLIPRLFKSSIKSVKAWIIYL